MTRPLLYVSTLIHNIDPDLVADGEIDTKVQAGIDRLVSMQTPSGGFGVWPGATEPVLWGTAYVVHLFIDAEKRGYKVPKKVLADAVDWMAAHAGEEGGPKFMGTHPGYVHYVLSLAGKPLQAEANALLASMGTPTAGPELEGRYLLMAALHKAGDRRYEKELRKVDTTTVETQRYNDWSYYSDLRRRGLTLSAYEELFGVDSAATPLADLVAVELGRYQSHGYTTQELMWAISGLGKWVSAPPKDLKPPTLLVNGAEVPLAQDRTDGKGSWGWQVAGASSATKVEVKLPGKGERSPLSLVVTTEGVKRDAAVQAGSAGLGLSQRFLDSEGNPVGGTVALGDLVYVEVTLQNALRREMENLAVVARIPAGWEIENPRLGRGALPDWIDPGQLWTLDYLDVKDDRVNAFGRLESGESKTVVFAVRAVTAGDFLYPPARAEAMYDPEVWARTGASEVEVTADWSAWYL